VERDYDGYDCLRYELFETLIPAMLYKGTEKERDEFFGFLKQDGKTIIHDMYQTLCEDDGLPYPYENPDFEVRIFERGGVNIMQIILPSYNPNINDILRAYFLFAKSDDGRDIRRYFLIKRFKNGSIFILNVNPKFEKLLGEELTEHAGDMEYEYWRLVHNYAKIILCDMCRNKRKNKTKPKSGKG
jgi:hypothetical protein